MRKFISIHIHEISKTFKIAATKIRHKGADTRQPWLNNTFTHLRIGFPWFVAYPSNIYLNVAHNAILLVAVLLHVNNSLKYNFRFFKPRGREKRIVKFADRHVKKWSWTKLWNRCERIFQILYTHWFSDPLIGTFWCLAFMVF